MNQERRSHAETRSARRTEDFVPWTCRCGCFVVLNHCNEPGEIARKGDPVPEPPNRDLRAENLRAMPLHLVEIWIRELATECERVGFDECAPTMKDLAYEFVDIVINTAKIADAPELARLLPTSLLWEVSRLFQRMQKTEYRWDQVYFGPGLSKDEHGQRSVSLRELDRTLTTTFAMMDESGD